MWHHCLGNQQSRTTLRPEFHTRIGGRVRCLGAATAALLLGVSKPAFAQCQNFKWGPTPNSSAGTRPYAIASDDLNGDGKADIAVASFDNNNVTILLGLGDGTFTPPAGNSIYNLGTNTRPKALVFGDFNQDTVLDIATANSGTGNVSILLGNGDGTFQVVATTYSTGAGSTPRAIAVAHLNGDSRLDIAVATDNNNTIAILKGRNNSPATLFFGAVLDATVASCCISAIGVADFNQDGVADIAVIRHETGNPFRGRLVILRGVGDGTFLPYSAASDYVAYVSSVAANSLAIGNFNADNFPDVAVANDGSPGSVVVLLNNLSGGFPAITGVYGVGNTPGAIGSGMVVSDIDGDSKLDIIVANLNSQSVKILKGNGNGTFASGGSPAVGSGPLSVCVTDLDGVYGKDIVVGNNTIGLNSVSVLLNANSLPEITLQPANRMVWNNYNATFTVSATDGSSYQWRLNKVNLADNATIFGSQGPQLTIVQASIANAGNYDCMIGNSCGMVTSATATLDVNPPCLGDFNRDGHFNGDDLQIVVDLLLEGVTCYPCK